MIWTAVAKKDSENRNIAFYVAMKVDGRLVFLSRQKDGSWDVYEEVGPVRSYTIVRRQNCKEFRTAKKWAERYLHLREWKGALQCRARLLGYIK